MKKKSHTCMSEIPIYNYKIVPAACLKNFMQKEEKREWFRTI